MWKFLREPWPEHLQAAGRAGGNITPEEASLLHDLAREVTTGCIVEVGSNQGRSTIALALGSKRGANVPVYAVDPRERPGSKNRPIDHTLLLRNLLDSFCDEQVRVLNTTSQVLAPGWEEPVGLLWIDGDRPFESVRADFGAWVPHLVDGAVVAFGGTKDWRGGTNQWAAVLVDGEVAEVIHEVGKVRVLRMTVPAPR